MNSDVEEGSASLFWSMLVCGIALIAILPDASWIYSSIAAYDSSRWAHFLEYAIVTAIPVGAWGRRSRVMISFIPYSCALLWKLCIFIFRRLAFVAAIFRRSVWSRRRNPAGHEHPRDT